MDISQKPVSPYDRIFLIASWFGIVTGLVEGLGVLVFQSMDWLRGQFTFLGSSLEVVWISPVLDWLLFMVVGLMLGLAVRLFPRLPVTRIAFFVFALLGLFSWIMIPASGRVFIWAVFIFVVGLAFQVSRWMDQRSQAILRFFQRSLAWLIAILLAAVVIVQGGFWLQQRIALTQLPAAAKDSPNILVIVMDTVRADHLSGYGYSRATSPNLDRIAQEGVLFEQAYSTSSWTEPAHGSLFTGRYVSEHGADNKPLDNRYPTIAEALYAHGYQTGAFSANFEAVNRHLGFGRGFIHFEDYYRSIKSILVNTVYGRMAHYYLLHRVLGVESYIDRRDAREINNAFLNWVDQAQQEHPFFAFINYYDAHDPYLPPEPYRSKFSAKPGPGGLINSDWDMNNIYTGLTPEQIQSEVDAYDGAVAYLDEMINDLIKELQKRNLDQNTLVIITSDHGEMFGEHGLLHHANSLYREVIHVPLIFLWPGHLPEGKRVEQPASIVAIPATLLDLVGAKDGATFRGPSLALLWTETGAAKDWPDPLMEMGQLPWVPDRQPAFYGGMKSIIDLNWHYIVHEKFGEELYDLNTDPKELQSQAQESTAQPLLARLRAALEALLSSDLPRRYGD